MESNYVENNRLGENNYFGYGVCDIRVTYNNLYLRLKTWGAYNRRSMYLLVVL